MEKENRLIAEFMGWTLDNEDLNSYRRLNVNTFEYSLLSNFKYHSSWDWLMPVVEKIEMLGFKIEKNFQPIDNDWQCLVVKGNNILLQEFNEDSIKAMHHVVSAFIKMYNYKNK